MNAILEWIRLNWRTLFQFIDKHKTWLAIGLALANSFVLIDILYTRFLFGGLQWRWPDAIVCFGAVGSADGDSTRSIYYLTHMDHQLNRVPVVSYRMIGSKPHTLHFHQREAKFVMTQDMDGLSADCIGKNLDWLLVNRRGLYLLSSRPFS